MLAITVIVFLGNTPENWRKLSDRRYSCNPFPELDIATAEVANVTKFFFFTGK